tara:strand:- start:434 stop:655 length:222 start_codon:yes stop_codon:yes gene_type:complete
VKSEGKLSAFLAHFPLGFLLGAILTLTFALLIDGQFDETVRKNWTYISAFIGTHLPLQLPLLASLPTFTINKA